MLRYFLYVNAQRPLSADGRSFEFEPVGHRGGSWLGILAVDDESMANILASSECQGLGVDEISADYFDSIKKKHSAGPNNSPASAQQPQTQPFAPVVAEPVARPTSQRSVEVPYDPHAGMMSAVQLLSTDRSPPAEPLLEESRKRRA